jgi:hypothetical protein
MEKIAVAIFSIPRHPFPEAKSVVFAAWLVAWLHPDPALPSPGPCAASAGD